MEIVTSTPLRSVPSHNLSILHVDPPNPSPLHVFLERLVVRARSNLLSGDRRGILVDPSPSVLPFRRVAFCMPSSTASQVEGLFAPLAASSATRMHALVERRPLDPEVEDAWENLPSKK